MQEFGIAFRGLASEDVLQKVFGLIFERFNYKRTGTIDIYDLLVSLSIISRIDDEKKLLRRIS